ncbi:bifunctional tetrahydrofolate synthase/dihydrofolate synthase [Halochromatium glycolicum]|uniref:Dihydrofolate synthase/folylpolyglutamate synthase n=1 Tax=Halochromatium glycolicum TaxID=85075 RepID=A0AAJ0U241_9GAMM|nr:bifunctional tetrahydrofolate synthase/dihydrofolate synthase [Halochromatium glycolicum]MBK1703874.1 bifunctional tetrahydrofolate synthase/dihydrofolate synthase [Halochromatium glycolicum]
MRFQNLDDWLVWQETLHPGRIELGLERIRSVWFRLSAQTGPVRLPFAVISVGGTNGKGSCVAYLDAWYRAAGYRCGAYTSPHLLRYNERIRIDGEMVSDDALCEAFERIDRARGEIALTYFEFGTLAALDLFMRADLDIAVLEVGLGGRLDAVNLVAADVALVASVGRDHMAWLGDDLASIATEKAGIFRAGRPAVIGQQDAPAALRERAEEIGAQPLQAGREFAWTAAADGWDWQGPRGRHYRALPIPALRGRHQYQNAAAALCALEQLAERLPVAPAAIRQGLLRAALPGRFTSVPGNPEAGTPAWVLDVAHNDQAACALAETLAAYPCSGQRLAVLALLSDKEPEAVIAPLAPLIDQWYLASAPSDRAMPLERMSAALAATAPGATVVVEPDLDAAFQAAAQTAQPDDLILIFGSFLTIEAALRSPLISPV